MAYVDKAAVKLYLGISTTDDDALLDALIARAQAAIEKDRGFAFEAASDTTRYFDACAIDGSELIFDTWISQITTVINGDGVSLSASDYVTMPRNYKPWFGLRLKDSSGIGWSAASNAIAVTGRWAYTVTADADIQHIAIRLTAWLYRRRTHHLLLIAVRQA